MPTRADGDGLNFHLKGRPKRTACPTDLLVLAGTKLAEKRFAPCRIPFDRKHEHEADPGALSDQVIEENEAAMPGLN
jgi:hypothetical protein